MASRRAITKAQAVRYRSASRAGKSEILNLVCAVTRFNRDYARRALKQALRSRVVKPRTARPPKYDAKVVAALQKCWAVVNGGIIEEWGPPKQALQAIMRDLRAFAPRESDNDYVVDLAMRSWHNFREPEFTGVRPDMVGRKQRRLIIWHSVPQGLETEDAVREWLARVLPETARLVREHLPTRSRAYPAEELALEVEALRAALLAHSQESAP